MGRRARKTRFASRSLGFLAFDDAEHPAGMIRGTFAQLLPEGAPITFTDRSRPDMVEGEGSGSVRLLAIVLLASVPGAVFAAAAPRPARAMPIFNPDAGTRASCPPIGRYEVSRRGGKLSPRHLDELPAADLYKAVYRRVGGCNVPIIVRYNIGRSEMGSGKR